MKGVDTGLVSMSKLHNHPKNLVTYLSVKSAGKIKMS